MKGEEIYEIYVTDEHFPQNFIIKTLMMIASETVGCRWRYNIEIYFTETVCDHLRCKYLEQDRDQRQTLFNTVVIFRVP